MTRFGSVGSRTYHCTSEAYSHRGTSQRIESTHPLAVKPDVRSRGGPNGRKGTPVVASTNGDTRPSVQAELHSMSVFAPQDPDCPIHQERCVRRNARARYATVSRPQTDVRHVWHRRCTIHFSRHCACRTWGSRPSRPAPLPERTGTVQFWLYLVFLGNRFESTVAMLL